MTKSGSGIFTVIMLLGSVVLPGFSRAQSSERHLDYFRAYRYQRVETPSQKGFRECQVLLRSLVRVYMDFAAMGSRHFFKDNSEFLDILLKKTDLLHTILMLSDRMVRNMAFVPGYYETDIKTGLAVDHHYPDKK